MTETPNFLLLDSIGTRGTLVLDSIYTPRLWILYYLLQVRETSAAVPQSQAPSLIEDK